MGDMSCSIEYECNRLDASLDGSTDAMDVSAAEGWIRELGAEFAIRNNDSKCASSY